LNRRFILIVVAMLCVISATMALAKPADVANGMVRVRLITSVGPILLALDAAHAPLTTANFMAYVDDGRFDGTTFYRSARNKRDAKFGYVQGGIRTDLRRSLPPVAHETTLQTGIRHLDATISMARGGPPGSAMGNFFITVGATPFMDATATNPGYAAFGHVVGGMDVVRQILGQPTGGGIGPMRGQMILRPIQIIRAQRIDGTARPTGRPQPWLLVLPTRRKR
jgi:peptidyl-prolyl cis-trans isomerase A (cyclophilin A)